MGLDLSDLPPELLEQLSLKARGLARLNSMGRPFYGNQNSSKTHCKYGHPLTGDNLRIGRGRSGKQQRLCRTCKRRRRREWRARQSQKTQTT